MLAALGNIASAVAVRAQFSSATAVLLLNTFLEIACSLPNGIWALHALCIACRRLPAACFGGMFVQLIVRTLLNKNEAAADFWVGPFDVWTQKVVVSPHGRCMSWLIDVVRIMCVC